MPAFRYAPAVVSEEEVETTEESAPEESQSSDAESEDSSGEISEHLAEESAQTTKSDEAPRSWTNRWAFPIAIYLICSIVYSVTLGDRALSPSADNHYVHLADSFLRGQLHHEGNPPGQNDWACYDWEDHDSCPNNRWSFGNQERYRWYVSFPPLPGAVIAPAVAIFGTDIHDRLFWAWIAGFGPALLFVLLRHLRESGHSRRTRKEDLALTALFAFGTVFFFVAVQGTVWFAAQSVAIPLLMAYLLFGIDARRPVLAGLMLGLVFLCRPTTAFLAIFFGLEALRTSQREDSEASEHGFFRETFLRLRGADWGVLLRKVALFSAPILVIGGIAMWMNQARFEDPFEFGHTYLQIRWRARIERWGLFNYHYFAKNLSVFLAGLPWLTLDFPHLLVSRHGLALWVTTPTLLMVLWTKRGPFTRALFAAVIPVALMNLCYQNSGWIQFGYRFALDYMPLLFVLLAVGRPKFSRWFYVALVWSIAINTFGAITFDRAGMFYDNDSSQEVVFQPD